LTTGKHGLEKIPFISQQRKSVSSNRADFLKRLRHVLKGWVFKASPLFFRLLMYFPLGWAEWRGDLMKVGGGKHRPLL
jgi:hypothetical protein